MDINFDEIKDSYIATLKKYSDFNGRSRRKEFWTFAACNVVISIAINMLGWTLHIIPFLGALIHWMMAVGFALVVCVPGIAVGVRRLHDTNRSGMMMLLFLVCCVGGLPVIYWATQEGTQGDNMFGPDPKAVPPATPTPPAA